MLKSTTLASGKSLKKVALRISLLSLSILFTTLITQAQTTERPPEPPQPPAIELSDYGDENEGEVIEISAAPKNEPSLYDFILLEQEPTPINMVEVKAAIGYPEEAKKNKIQGKVLLRILIGKDGKYIRHIVTKNPNPILTEAVENQIHNLQFTPGIQRGEAIKVWITIPFDFKLLQ